MEKRTFHYPKESSLIPILLGIVMTAASGLLIYLSRLSWWHISILGGISRPFSLGAGIFGVFYFGFSLLYLVYRRFADPVVFEVTEEGVIDSSTIFSSRKLLPYEDMRSVRVEFYHGQRYIAIDVHDEEALLAQMPLIKRRAMKMSKNVLDTSLITVNLPGKSRKEYDEVVKYINQIRRERKLIP